MLRWASHHLMTARCVPATFTLHSHRHAYTQCTPAARVLASLSAGSSLFVNAYRGIHCSSKMYRVPRCPSRQQMGVHWTTAGCLTRHAVQARLDHEDEVGASSSQEAQQRAAALGERIAAALATRQRGFYLQHGLQVKLTSCQCMHTQNERSSQGVQCQSLPLRGQGHLPEHLGRAQSRSLGPALHCSSSLTMLTRSSVHRWHWWAGPMWARAAC